MKKKLVVLTGAGVSAESGIPTFRDAVTGLWENASITEVCTAGCLERNEERAYRFYAELHDKYKDCKPNQAHYDIASLENDYDVTVITQNVDNLHEQAGSTNVLHLHGELSKVRALDDDSLLWDWDDTVIMHEDTIIDGHHIRPHIVMFGEDVPNIPKASEIMKEADICIVIGTSFNVYPAAGLISFVEQGNPIYYIDPKPAYTPDYPDIKVIKASATDGMKQLLPELVRSGTILHPDESCELGVFYEKGKLYAGYISNSGANKEWSIDYDEDFTFEENLQTLYEVIQEDYDSRKHMDS